MPDLTTLTLQGTMSYSNTGGDPPSTSTANASWSSSFDRATMQDLNKYPFTKGFGGLDYWVGGIPFTALPFPYTFVLWCDQLAPHQTLAYGGSHYYVSSGGVALPPDYHPVIGSQTVGDGDPSDIVFSRVSFAIGGVKAGPGLYNTNTNSGYGLQPGACQNRDQPYGSQRRTPYQDPGDWIGGNFIQNYVPDVLDYVATRIQSADFNNGLPEIQLITLQPDYYPNQQRSFGSHTWPTDFWYPAIVPTGENPTGGGIHSFLSNPQDFQDSRLSFHYPIRVDKLWEGLVDPDTTLNYPIGVLYIDVICKSPQEVLLYLWPESQSNSSFDLLQGRSIKYAGPDIISESGRTPEFAWENINAFTPPPPHTPWNGPPYTSGIGVVSIETNAGHIYGQGRIDLDSGDISFTANDNGTHTYPGPPSSTTTWSYYVSLAFG